MFCYKIEFETHAKLVGEINEILKDAVEKIKPVIEKFDGKVVNKRLITALESVCGTCNFSLCYSGEDTYLSITSRERMAMYQSNDNFGLHSNCVYTSHNEVRPKCYINENNRLDSAETINNLDKYLASFLEYSEQIKWESDHYDELKAERDKLRDMINTYESKLTYCGTDLRVRR